MNLIQKIRDSFSTRKIATNQFNEAFFSMLGGGYTGYDAKGSTYVSEGYNKNADVYSIINAKATKVSSIPFYIKTIENKESKALIDKMQLATGGNYTIEQKARKLILESKAFSSEYKNLPLDRPNQFQSWTEFLALYETFLSLTGNIYIYMVSPSIGRNEGVPNQIYLLPSHQIQIILKPKADFLSTDNPISHYTLIEGNSYIDFKAKDVIHIKLSNPNFDLSGSHLYGQSPLKASLTNLQSSNEAKKNNIKTMSNGGAFGFIYGKGSPLTPEQAAQLKSRLQEMDSDTGRMGKISGISSEVGFQRISLTTDELKPFEYLSYDQKALCNVLGWSSKLLENHEDSSGLNNGALNETRKQVLIDSIQPHLRLLEEALDNEFLPRFRGFENTVFCFDISELPEMQDDMTALTNWLNNALDRGVLNRDEYRTAINYTSLGTPEMQTYTVTSASTTPLSDLIDNLVLDE